MRTFAQVKHQAEERYFECFGPFHIWIDLAGNIHVSGNRMVDKRAREYIEKDLTQFYNGPTVQEVGATVWIERYMVQVKGLQYPYFIGEENN